MDILKNIEKEGQKSFNSYISLGISAITMEMMNQK